MPGGSGKTQVGLLAAVLVFPEPPVLVQTSDCDAGSTRLFCARAPPCVVDSNRAREYRSAAPSLVRDWRTQTLCVASCPTLVDSTVEDLRCTTDPSVITDFLAGKSLKRHDEGMDKEDSPDSFLLAPQQPLLLLCSYSFVRCYRSCAEGPRLDNLSR